MMAETEADVLAEWHRALNALAGVHSIATASVPAYLKYYWEPAFSVSERGDTETVAIGHGLPGEPGTRSFTHTTVGQMRVDMAADGPIVARLGQQWLVMVYTDWEHEFRPRIATARGVKPAEVTVPVMGDVRLMRNDVVHRGGVATEEYTGKCQLLQWFKPGEDILVTSQMVAEFMGHHGLLRPA